MAPSRADAQSASPSVSRPFVPPKLGFLSGTVSAAESFDLEQVERVGGTPNGAVRFSIAVIEGASAAEPFAIPDLRAEVAPFVPLCKKYFAIFSGPTPEEVKGLVGKTMVGAVSLEKPERSAEESQARCVLAAGIERALPKAKRESFNLFRVSDTPGTLAQLKRARALFEPDLASVRFYDQTPLDSAIGYAFRDMKSREALELALAMRLYSSVSRNSTWSNDPDAYGAFERALLGPDAQSDPHPYLARLFWNASPAKARERVAGLVDDKPEVAAEILRTNAGWVDASTLFEQLVDDERVKLGAPRALLGLSTEDAFLARHRAKAGAFGEDIDKTLGASKERGEMGITDGWSLVRWIAKNKITPRHHEGMRVTLVGQKAYCCDLRGLVSEDVDLEVRVDCDAGERKRRCADKSVAPLTVTGVVKTAQHTTHRLKPGAPDRPIVRLELQYASVIDGGEIPAPASLDDVPAARTAPPVTDAPSSGCNCELDGARRPVDDPSGALGPLALVAGASVMISRRRRRGRSGAGERASPARGRAG